MNIRDSLCIISAIFLAIPLPAISDEVRSPIQFVAFGDVQANDEKNSKEKRCRGPKIFANDQVKKIIKAINEFANNPAVKWPNGEFPNGDYFSQSDKEFFPPESVLIAGDLTENADGNNKNCKQWEEFDTYFPAGGGSVEDPRTLNYPSFEGLGNHDFPFINVGKKTPDRLGEMLQSDAIRKYISKKIEDRHLQRKNFQGDLFWDKVTKKFYDFEKQPGNGLGGYVWRSGDIYFFNLNVKPSGHEKPKKGCTSETHQSQFESRRISNELSFENVYIKDCQELIRKSNPVRYRLVDPLRSLSFLDNAEIQLSGTSKSTKITNRQIVIMTHYGPENQSRLSDNELKEFCAVLEERKLRVIAWIVGHTHRSNYYEWSCNGYRVPVVNAGSPYYKMESNSGQVMFGYFRISDSWLEAVNIGFDPSADGIYHVPSLTRKNVKFKCDPSQKAPFGIRKDAEFDFDDTDQGVWCNPDGLWGGWKVRVPICPKNVNPYNSDGSVNIVCTNGKG